MDLTIPPETVLTAGRNTAPERQIDFLLDVAGLARWRFDFGSHRFDGSRHFEEVLGTLPSAGAWTYESFLEHVLSEDCGAVAEAFERATRGEGDWRVECRFRRADGALRWINLRGRLWNEEGDPSVMMGTLEDVTGLKLRSMRRQFLVTLMQAARPMTDPAEIMGAATRMLGEHLGVNRCLYAELEADENHFTVAGEYVWNAGSMNDHLALSDFGDAVVRLMRAGDVFAVEDTDSDPRVGSSFDSYRRAQIEAVICVPLNKDGRLVAIMAVHQKRPRRWTEDEIELVRIVVGQCWEALERARLDRSLRASERRLQAITDSVDQMIWSTTPDGFHDYFNRRWYEFTGVPYGSTEGEGWNGTFHPDDQERAWAVWRRSLDTGVPYHIEYRLRHHSGSYRWVLGRALPVRDEEGRITRWFGTCTDIQEIIEVRDALARSRKELADLNATLEDRVARRTAALEQSNRELQDFAFAAHHDLQEPLRKASTFADLIMLDYGDCLDDEGRFYVARIQTAAARMSNLLRNLVTYAGLPTQSQPFREVDLNEIAAAVQADLERLRQESEGRIEVDLLPSIEADAAQMRRLLHNLIENALTYRREGIPPVVRVWATEVAGGRRIRLVVGDNGIGFEERYLDRILQPFQRLHSRARFEGTGMGLAICRRIAEEHGGALTAESTLGEGSRFIVELPGRRPADGSAKV